MDEFTRFKKNTSQNVVTVNSDRTKLNFDVFISIKPFLSK